jgi:acetyltransferase-like isoleucine patch superfamily enzyme
VPPLACRFTLLLLGRPTITTQVGSRQFFAWWMSMQWQNLFLRFPALEEALRMIPGVYSSWLRLWGAKIGKYTYWTAGCKVLDRPFVTIGDFVIVGFGAKITSHLFHMKMDDSFFLFGEPVIGDYAVLGGDCGVGPGAKIPARHTVPAGAYVSPFKKNPREIPDAQPEVRA